jgi:Alcohol dehydrogenase, class IV
LGISDFRVNDAMLEDAMGAAQTRLNPRTSTREDIKALFECVR